MMKEKNKEEKQGKGSPAVLIQFVIGVLLSGGVILLYPWPDTFKEQLKTVTDAFSIISLLYLCIGALLLVSSTGFFDIFGFAIRRGAHAFVPGMIKDNTSDYYEYLEDKKLKRKSHSLKSTFAAGVLLFIIAAALTIWWCIMFS